MIRLFVALALVSLSFGCGHKKIVVAPPAALDTAAPLSMWGSWVKPKAKKFDAEMHLKNNSSANAIIMAGDLRCFRGDSEGVARINEKMIDFGAGQERTVLIHCELRHTAAGEFKIAVSRVFDNPSNDRHTPGKEIAKDIEWKNAGN